MSKTENQYTPCVIIKDLPEAPGTSRHVGISQDMYARILDLSRETGRSMRWLCNHLLSYALDHMEIRE